MTQVNLSTTYFGYPDKVYGLEGLEEHKKTIEVLSVVISFISSVCSIQDIKKNPLSYFLYNHLVGQVIYFTKIDIMIVISDFEKRIKLMLRT